MNDRPLSSPFSGLSRRQLLRGGMLGIGALAAAPMLSACGSSSSSSASPSGAASGASSKGASKVRFQFNWVPDVEWSSWYLADTNGYFTGNGVEVELLHGGENTPAVAQLVEAGQCDMAVASDALQLIKANAQGSDLVVIGAMYQRSPFGYTWLTKSDISEPADLVDKRIGGVQGDQISIEAVFKVNDLSPKYTFVPMSYDPSPLVKGEMVAITSYTTNQPIQLRMQGVDVTTVTFSDFGLKSYGDVLFAKRSYLEKNRDAVVGVLAGLLEGTKANMADPTKAVALTVDKYGKENKLDAEFEKQANAGYIELLTSDYTKSKSLLAIDPAFLENEVFKGYTLAGEKSLPKISDFLDTSFIEAAAKA